MPEKAEFVHKRSKRKIAVFFYSKFLSHVRWECRTGKSERLTAQLHTPAISYVSQQYRHASTLSFTTLFDRTQSNRHIHTHTRLIDLIVSRLNEPVHNIHLQSTLLQLLVVLRSSNQSNSRSFVVYTHSVSYSLFEIINIIARLLLFLFISIFSIPCDLYATFFSRC